MHNRVWRPLKTTCQPKFNKTLIMRYWVFVCITFAASLCYATDLQAQTSGGESTEDDRPNIVWIIAEDTSPFLIGAYGGPPARTPNIDQLAENGVRYTNAFALNGACAPNRSALMTGLWPPSYGAHHMRTMRRTAAIDRIEDPELLAIPTYEAVPPPEVRLVPEQLRAHGYFTTNEAKTDYQFVAPSWVWNESSDRATWRPRTNPDQPFFSVFNIGISHESVVWKNEDKPLETNPDAVTVPPYYPDTPVVRRDLARYYDNVALMDERVGQIMAQLRADGLLDETIVFFFSDHGTGLPRMKRTLYDSGLRVPLVVRVPEKYQSEAGSGAPGTASDRLISFLDFAPTLLRLAGVEVPAYMHGQPFLGSQEGEEREYVYAHRDRMAPALNTRRAVSDGRFKYIRDYRPEKPFLQFIPYRNRENHLMREILRYKEEGRLDSTQQWQWLVEEMPKQELYDTKNDPYETQNLAGDPRYRDKLTELRRVERRWWRRTNDMGLTPEPVLKNILWPPLGEQPTTAPPSVHVESSSGSTAKIMRLESDTRGASIGYKVNGREAWQVYHEPLKLPEGDTLRAQAHRIGYKASPVTTWAPPEP